MKGEGMMFRYYARILAAAVTMGLVLTPAQLLARSHSKAVSAISKRKVVLMDFSGPALADSGTDGVSAPSAEPAIADVARQMAGVFTNVSPSPPVLYGSFPTPIPSASDLPNPFLTRAVTTLPSLSVPAFNAGGSCAQPDYLPDYSHGRAAEARRRLIFPLVHQAACEQGLPIGLFDALIMQESRYNHLAISPKGALGLAQLMPGTARQLGTDPYSLIDNLRGGARYLRQQVDRFGRYDLALAAYNSGPGRVARLGRVPAIAETMEYVSTISANWSRPRTLAVNATTPSRSAAILFMPYYERSAPN